MRRLYQNTSRINEALDLTDCSNRYFSWKQDNKKSDSVKSGFTFVRYLSLEKGCSISSETSVTANDTVMYVSENLKINYKCCEQRRSCIFYQLHNYLFYNEDYRIQLIRFDAQNVVTLVVNCQR
jgi:hypothetical protein